MTEDNSEKGVKLFKQTYQEFASRGLEQELECLGMVYAVVVDKSEKIEGTKNSGVFTEKTLTNVEEALQERAKDFGATHVFGIEYQFVNPNGRMLRIYAGGDAYRPKKDKNGPYR